ncbi:MAG: hypothetical protein AB7W16_23655 [Candidatus Obscuribacterales bacterium]
MRMIVKGSQCLYGFYCRNNVSAGLATIIASFTASFTASFIASFTAGVVWACL